MIELLVLLLTLGASVEDETVAAYAPEGVVYHLETINGVTPAYDASLDVGTPGRVFGVGPCGPFRATQTLPYPWFDIDEIDPGPAPCTARAAETALLAHLRAASLVEVLGDTLILSDVDGFEMVFQSRP